ncbi:hypothetical protein ACFLRX_08035, partial [Acidobacteriota bacterium]
LKKIPLNSEYQNAVFDCLLSVFGAGHRELERALGEAGFLDEFSERVKQQQPSSRHEDNREVIDPEVGA